MPELEIIGLPQSNFVWATRIAAASKGVPHRSVSAAPHSAEVLAIHPLGKIPVMRHGDVTLAESRAICGYIDHSFDGPALVPADPRRAAVVEQWTSLIVTSVEPALIRRYLFGYLFPGTPDGAPDRVRIDAALPDLERHLAVVGGALESGHLAGEAVSLADCFLIPILFYLKQLPESGQIIARSPALGAYLDRQMALSSVQETVPPPLPR